MASKRLNFTVFVVLASLMAVAGVAWACTPQPRVMISGPGYGPSGSQVLVTGESFHIGEPVQIRWNTLTGPKLAEATTDGRGVFSVPVTIPDAASGVYLVLTNGTGDEEPSGVSRTSFEVLPSLSANSSVQAAPSEAPSTLSNDLWKGFGRSSGSVGDSVASGTGDQPNSMASGLALSAAGIVVLAGVGVATIARRRKQAA